MSIILYSGGVISADSRGVIDQGATYERLTVMMKLFSFGEEIVMGMVGDNVSIKYACREFCYFSEKIKDGESRRLDTIPISENIIKEYTKENEGRTLCFMTRRKFYVITSMGLEATVEGIPWACGSGGRIALQSLVNGCTVEESVRNAVAVMPTCGGTIQTFRRSDLKLIPLRRK